MGLREYVIRRIGHLVITYWAFITILFFLFRIMPGDPVSRFVYGGLSAEARQEIIERMGLNDPLHVQYLKYMGQLLHGEFGRSFIYGEPVWNIITVKFWNTIFLTGSALVLSAMIGVLVGALLGWRRDSALEKVGIVTTLVTRSSPSFWTGIVLIMVFVIWLDWFPSGGIRPIGAEVTPGFGKYLSWSFIHHAALPVLTATLYWVGAPLLLMRNTMLETLNADFIEIKEAEGIPPFSILYRHAARNSILPIVTMLASSVGLIVGGSVVIETVFNWPGMGQAMVEAIYSNDYPLAMAAFFLMGSVVIFMNFVADLLYVYLDPRVKYD